MKNQAVVHNDSDSCNKLYPPVTGGFFIFPLQENSHCFELYLLRTRHCNTTKCACFCTYNPLLHCSMFRSNEGEIPGKRMLQLGVFRIFSSSRTVHRDSRMLRENTPPASAKCKARGRKTGNRKPFTGVSRAARPRAEFVNL